MSLMWLFRRFVDPNAHREVQEDLRRQREDWPPDIQPDETGFAPPRSADKPVDYVCRVCGLESQDGAFCPTCLADTMQPRK